MKLRILSDLHFEFHPDGQSRRAFVKKLPVDCDVLVLAGDLATKNHLFEALEIICAHFPQVIYVHGNHEFYGSCRQDVLATTAKAAARNLNLHVLDKTSITIDGVTFHGAPLWFRDTPRVPRHVRDAMSDFHAIAGFEKWVYDECEAATRFLTRAVQPGDVVVTHHLPVRESIAPRWRGSPLNAFFLCDMENLIRAASPALWVHGHTHDSRDFRVAGTRVVCNPFGYLVHDENPKFDGSLTVEVMS